MDKSSPHIDICIATYKRPLLLLKLVYSLLGQKTDNLFTYSLIIVDNDPELSGIKIIKTEVKNKDLISLYCQAEKNISLTRNLAVHKSNGEYLAFVDDDEYVCKDWLLRLFRCMRNFDVDCVHGPVVSYFPDDTPKWLIKYGFLNRKRFKTGKTSYGGSTNNCLIKSEVIKKYNTPFDPEFGLTGGEDTDFFSRITEEGHSMVWCDEAEVYEYVGHRRANFRWLLQRSFRGGNSYIIRKNRKKKIGTKTLNLNISLAKFFTVLAAFPLCLILGVFEIRFLIKPVTKLTEYCGQIIAFLGYQYKEYK